MIKSISLIQNKEPAKFQRYFAAAKFIEILGSGKRLINIDESIVKFTDHRKGGWVPNFQQNKITNTKRLHDVNIVASLCSTGEVWYTINCGKNNS